VKEITGFYRIYHSARWVGEKLVIRIARALSAAGVAELNDKFADVLRRGAIVQGKALPRNETSPRFSACRGSFLLHIDAALDVFGN
jgi:hypothetical protein